MQSSAYTDFVLELHALSAFTITQINVRVHKHENGCNIYEHCYMIEQFIKTQQENANTLDMWTNKVCCRSI